MSRHSCRACRGEAGQSVLDLGRQPAADHFPQSDDPGPDQLYALEMWLCLRCGLAQLRDDATVPEEPKGAEPRALVDQAADALRRVALAGLLPAGARVAEYGSPHGGSWLGLLAEQGFRPAGPAAAGADVIIDCFGMMHAADQAAAVGERAARLAPDGILLLQYHSLDTIIRLGQWNVLRHGHYAYYSTAAMVGLLARAGLSPLTGWRFDLYGGTVLLAASRRAPGHADSGAATSRAVPAEAGTAVRDLLEAEMRTGVLDPTALSGLQRNMQAQASALHGWLATERAAGRVVLGYGAASRAVALLRKAEIDHTLLSAVADASPAKWRLRMPGTRIPIISPTELIRRRPDAVLVFVPDLIGEVLSAYPELEAARWVVADGSLSS